MDISLSKGLQGVKTWFECALRKGVVRVLVDLVVLELMIFNDKSNKGPLRLAIELAKKVG